MPAAARWSPETGSLHVRTLHAAYRDGSLTPEAVVDAVHARIVARGPDPARTSLVPRERALGAAWRRATGLPMGATANPVPTD